MIIDEPIQNSYKLKTNKLVVSNFDKEMKRLEAIKIDDSGNRIYKYLMSHF